jgi:hypothetical protein
MAKPVAPKIESVPSRDIQQIGRLQAEIDSLSELADRKAISRAAAADQIKQRQRAQLLLCKKAADTPTVVLSAQKKKAALEEATPIINGLNKRKAELEKAKGAASPTDASALAAELTEVEVDLAILKRAKYMLEHAPV